MNRHKKRRGGTEHKGKWEVKNTLPAFQLVVLISTAKIRKESVGRKISHFCIIKTSYEVKIML